MSHFAKVENGIVTQVIVAEQDVINTGMFGDISSWIQTSYNTYGGKHNLGGNPLRKNYAGIGYTYDAERDAFYSPKPFLSWILDEDTCIWVAPIAQPEQIEGFYYNWNEETLSWDSNEILQVPVLTAETPIEETPIEETPSEETPIQETPSEETPPEETPIEETPSENTPIE